MKFKNIILLLLLMCLSSTGVHASPCGRDGWTALRANEGSGFMFYQFRNTPDVYFFISGKEISLPDGESSNLKFSIDGILYQSLLVKPSAFMKAEQGVADLDILKKHQKYEFDFVLTTPTPLRKFDELGPRVKAAANGQPGFTFYLWKAADPKDEKGSRQYFLTTVSGGEVVVLSAIVRDEAADDLAMQAFESYANSFQHVLKKEDCPENPK